MRFAILAFILGAAGCANLTNHGTNRGGQTARDIEFERDHQDRRRRTLSDAELEEYRVRRGVLVERRRRGCTVALPPETPRLPMGGALADVSRLILECDAPRTGTPAVATAPQPARVEQPVQPVVQAPPPPAPVTEARPPEQEMETADPIPEFPQELLDEVRRTLHRAIDGDAPDASVTALARSLHSMEEGEKDAVLDCIEQEGGSVRSERVPDRRLRRLRTAVRNCVSPPEPEATPGQLAEVAEGIMADTVGTGGSPRGQSYSAALDGVGFVDFYPYRWKNAGRRRVSIRNSSNLCFLEVQLDGASVRMVMGETPVLAPVEGRPGTFVPVIPPNRVGSYVLPDDEWHPQRLICHQGTIDELGPAGTIVRLNGQLVMMASSGPVRPVESRESEIRSSPYIGARSISELDMHRIASRE